MKHKQTEKDYTNVTRAQSKENVVVSSGMREVQILTSTAAKITLTNQMRVLRKTNQSGSDKVSKR